MTIETIGKWINPPHDPKTCTVCNFKEKVLDEAAKQTGIDPTEKAPKKELCECGDTPDMHMLSGNCIGNRNLCPCKMFKPKNI